jgi:hypothetical protein
MSTLDEPMPKSCPCCEGLAIVCAVLRDAPTNGWEKVRHVVKCDECALSTWEFKTREEAIEAWNRRANRWSAFSDEELVIFDYYLDIEVENQPSETRLKMVEELQVELSRRHATGEGEI